MTHIHTAQDALQTEINGLIALKDSLDDNFSRAIDIIDTMKSARQGRLIVAGIGKSGHVSRKLAATFASTGTPAYYVHPGEASHGDLGMITRHDVVLMLSNSGENSELSDLIAYTRRFDIHLIAMTGNPQSTLAKHADTVLLIPKMPEACPNGMAPTTSTTMMMALGDALAVTLLKNMGLTREDFGVWHPGGKLGQRLLKVSELMHPYESLPLVTPTQTMQEAILELSDKNLGCVLVAGEDRHLLGIITDGDLKRHMSPDLLQKAVKDIMSTNPRAITPDALGVEAVNIMTRTPGKYLTSLVVIKDNHLDGLIRLQDCLQAGLS
ncbi:MAG: KpsF/GutQ family sugar-phosphate isomerase [Rhodospirillales bacterium]|nr:KpsF/GutQ family sugar-phosphate isomerase [Rhodospirillales bacterium]